MDELEQKYDDRRYRAYITDALMEMVNNIGHAFGGTELTNRWIDGYKPVDTRTGYEIAIDVIKNAGLVPMRG